MELKKRSKIPLGLTFDLERFFVTARAKQFLEKNEGDLNSHCHQFTFFAIEKLFPFIEHIRWCGSDFHHYIYNPEKGFPTPGEHLPLGFKRKINNFEVEDRLNHLSLLSKIKEKIGDKNIDLVIEISARKEYDLISSLKESRKYLKRVLEKQ